MFDVDFDKWALKNENKNLITHGCPFSRLDSDI
jgi:hypothetical protein